MRFLSGDRRMARTSAIGLRRDPQPPIPIVIPSRSSATTSSGVIRVTAGPVHERLARPVPGAGQVQLEGEALLVPVGALDVDRVDAVQRLLGQPDDRRVLGRDLVGHGSCGGAQLVRRHHLEHRAEGEQLPRGDGPAGVDHGPHQRLRHQPGQVRGRAQRAAVDLGQPERRVVGRDHDVGVAGQADAAAEAEAVHRGDHRHRAVVDGGERGEAALVGADQRLVPPAAAASP